MTHHYGDTEIRKCASPLFRRCGDAYFSVHDFPHNRISVFPHLRVYVSVQNRSEASQSLSPHLAPACAGPAAAGVNTRLVPRFGRHPKRISVDTDIRIYVCKMPVQVLHKAWSGRSGRQDSSRLCSKNEGNHASPGDETLRAQSSKKLVSGGTSDRPFAVCMHRAVFYSCVSNDRRRTLRRDGPKTVTPSSPSAGVEL